jgi:UDP-glucuronate 4-epimerase
LITGAAGFVGSFLTHHLLKTGNEVLATDNFDSYYSADYKRVRFETIVGNSENLSFLEFDLCNGQELNEIIRLNSPDCVIHLAGQAGVRLSKEDNIKYINSNIKAFCNTLGAVTRNGISTFLYASSSSVYGNALTFPLSEKQSEPKPISFYGHTKLINEIVAEMMVESSETNILGLRLFSVYGPWGRPDMAYFKITDSLVNQLEFKMYGDGKNIRDMTHIEDVVTSIELLSEKIYRDGRLPIEVINIGGGHPYSLNELISTLEDVSGLKLKVKRESASDLDTFRTEANFDTLKSLISFKPRIEIYEGAKSLINWAMKPEIGSKLKDWR